MFHVKQLCLIGKPLNHSLSPFIHSVIAKTIGVKIKYDLLEFEKIDIDILKEYDGFNVTMPYKKAVIPYLDSLTETAENILSVNVVKREKGKFKGHSTDGEGFIEDFHRSFNCDFYNKNVCIMGTGATSRALSYEILKENPKNIFYLSREKKGERVFSYEDRSFLKDCHIIINTTPAGMKDDICLLDREDIHENVIIYDVIYSRKTPLLLLGETYGGKVSNGLGMLVYQGIGAWEFWENMSFNEKTKERIVKEVINEI